MQINVRNVFGNIILLKFLAKFPFLSPYFLSNLRIPFEFKIQTYLLVKTL